MLSLSFSLLFYFLGEDFTLLTFEIPDFYVEVIKFFGEV